MNNFYFESLIKKFVTLNFCFKFFLPIKRWHENISFQYISPIETIKYKHKIDKHLNININVPNNAQNIQQQYL